MRVYTGDTQAKMPADNVPFGSDWGSNWKDMGYTYSKPIRLKPLGYRIKRIGFAKYLLWVRYEGGRLVPCYGVRIWTKEQAKAYGRLNLAIAQNAYEIWLIKEQLAGHEDGK